MTLFIRTAEIVRDLRVLLDSEPTPKQYIGKVACFHHHHLRRLCPLRRRVWAKTSPSALCLQSSCAARIQQFSIYARLCIKRNCSASARVQNAAAQSSCRSMDYVSYALLQLHRLPVKYRIIFLVSSSLRTVLNLIGVRRMVTSLVASISQNSLQPAFSHCHRGAVVQLPTTCSKRRIAHELRSEDVLSC